MKRLFIDLDGTLAVWKSHATYDDLYKKGYFFELPPQDNVLEGIRLLISEYRLRLECYFLSCYLADSSYALEEKASWCKRYIPEIPMKNYVFVPCGRSKKVYVPEIIRQEDYLLDDYTKNLLEWPGTGVKCINGINHTSGIWKGEHIKACWEPSIIADSLAAICAV